MIGDVHIFHRDIPGRWIQITGKNAHAGGLACSIGTQQAQNFSFVDLEVDAVKRTKITVILGQAFYLDHLILLFWYDAFLQDPVSDDCNADRNFINLWANVKVRRAPDPGQAERKGIAEGSG
jgi:hypothetical protein